MGHQTRDRAGRRVDVDNEEAARYSRHLIMPEVTMAGNAA